ncbi:hypothetical protein [Acaryochloris sp. CCMEE 5410]|uniref:hypothetical protein n=1 Tax=Acaryochloris sp. CCMEE 5410 TaxID=310037 RepID=UPI0002483A7E|nr:hypothetical protein [Acaryochloris sp. CCMEE 5410]KAI9133654.1 hypothetical protein ON05_010335 [Acaryochloris sp. CCMEE 5410]
MSRLWGKSDQVRIENRLQALMDLGQTLEDALWIVREEEKIGTMHLWPAVECVANVNKREAKRIVIRAFRHPPNLELS